MTRFFKEWDSLGIGDLHSWDSVGLTILNVFAYLSVSSFFHCRCVCAPACAYASESVHKWYLFLCIPICRVSQNFLLPTSKISPTVPSYWKCVWLSRVIPLQTLYIDSQKSESGSGCSQNSKWREDQWPMLVLIMNHGILRILLPLRKHRSWGSNISLKTHIWALRLGIEPLDWNLGLF